MVDRLTWLEFPEDLERLFDRECPLVEGGGSFRDFNFLEFLLDNLQFPLISPVEDRFRQRALVPGNWRDAGGFPLFLRGGVEPEVTIALVIEEPGDAEGLI